MYDHCFSSEMCNKNTVVRLVEWFLKPAFGNACNHWSFFGARGCENNPNMSGYSIGVVLLYSEYSKLPSYFLS